MEENLLMTAAGPAAVIDYSNALNSEDKEAPHISAITIS